MFSKQHNMVYQLPHAPGADRLRGFTLTAITTLICATGFLLFGYDQGVMAAPIEEPMMASTMPMIGKYEPGGDDKDYVSSHKSQYGIHVDLDTSQYSDNIRGAIVGCYELGAMIGAIIVLWKGDAIGRRWSVVFGSIIMTIGTIIMVAGDTLAPFTVGRVIAGVGNGLNTSPIPMLQSELSKAKYRGLLVFVEGALLAGGVMVSYWINYGFYWIDHKQNSVQWRFPIAFQIVFALVLGFGMFIVPESPRWLVKKGNSDQAHDIIARLQNRPLDDPEVLSELHFLQDSIRRTEEAMGKFQLKELLDNGPSQNFYRTCLGCGAQCMQQWTGINNLTYYANTVFNMVGEGDTKGRLLVCGSGIIYFAAAIAAIFIIDLGGRRNLMIWCACGMMICFAIMAGMIEKLKQGKDEGMTYKTYGKVAEAFIYLYFIPWSFGWLGMTWLYPPEITPIRIRAPASALSTITNWIMNFTVVMISPPAFQNLGGHTFTMFGAFNLIFMPIVYCLYPETKKRGLEEMDLIFADAHDQGFWKATHFQTTAVYLSVTRPFLSAEELDDVLAEREGFGTKGKDVEGGNDMDPVYAPDEQAANHIPENVEENAPADVPKA